jgi:diguanylate cyclase (GGDEF)-like protein
LSATPCEAEHTTGDLVTTLPPSLLDPLMGLPSVLAIRDLRRRIRRASAGPMSHAQALTLLRLDPPAVLRTMRAAAAPIYSPQRDYWSIDAIGAALGPSLTRRAIDVPAIDVTGTGPLRRLWLHSVATARAAEMLATSTGILPPDEAYVLGLLHDLPLWLEYVGRRHDGAPPPGGASKWVRHWGLPGRLAELLEGVAATHSSASPVLLPTSPASLICAAELLAELADFTHPQEGDPRTNEQLLETVGREDFLAAQRLRRDVEQDLRGVGLDLVMPEPEADLERAELQEDLDLQTGRTRAATIEIVLSVLGCSKSSSYRGIITAATAAALRYLGFDRAFYVKWVRATGRLAVRTKADLSARRIRTTVIEPNPAERDELVGAQAMERPVRLSSKHGAVGGLMHLIGADEAIAVPLNHDFQVPAFLVLDRSLSARPVHLLREADLCSSLGITTSLLNENLLLKRRRQRAQKFALTDPLTRLFNRRMGIGSLDQEVARAQRNETPLTVLMIDLDDFKRLNDTFGHLQGDHALRATAEVLRKTLRKSDTICRYGGEEFLVVLPETNSEDAAILAARLFTAVEARGREIGLPVTASIGQASMRSGDSVETLLQRADQALYASKSQGRNRFSVDDDVG